MLVATPALGYEVKSGDTFGGIASKNGLSQSQLAQMNPQIDNKELIFPGQQLSIDGTQTESNTAQVGGTQTEAVAASTSEFDLLARTIRAEAEGEPYAGQVAVGHVVLNRVDAGSHPNSIEGVIYEAGQFSPVIDGSIHAPADAQSTRAAEEALATHASSGNDAMFFYNPAIATNNWLDSRSTTETIGNHVFKQ